MKHPAVLAEDSHKTSSLISLERKTSKNPKCPLLQFLIGALRVNLYDIAIQHFVFVEDLYEKMNDFHTNVFYPSKY